MFLVTARQMSRMDKNTIVDYGIPGTVLMENAGRGATRVLLSAFGSLKNKKTGIIAGSGNNGGDGFVIARNLIEKGFSAEVFLLAQKEKIKGDAALNLSLLSDLEIPVTDISEQENFSEKMPSLLACDIWIDAIFGTGLNTDVRGLHKSVIEFINQSEKPVLSIDIPSGLHPDNGQPLGISIKADVTATFGYAKTGLVTYPGMDYSGRLEIIDIGIPNHIAGKENLTTRLLTPEIISSLYRPRSSNEHKGSTGHLAILAGSTGKTGAAALTTQAAVRSGTGLVTLCIPETLNPVMETLLPEAMSRPLPEICEGEFSQEAFHIFAETATGKNCLALGPGIGTRKATEKLVTSIIADSRVPLVLDADALNIVACDLSILKKAGSPVILTPHPRELSRLTGLSVEHIQKNRLDTAKEFAGKHNVYLVLKGARSVIAHPDGSLFINPTGNPAMASGGMGDALTGIISGFIAQGYSPGDSANIGVYLHGAAADILAEEYGPAGITASDLIHLLPEMIKKMAENDLTPIKNIGYRF